MWNTVGEKGIGQKKVMDPNTSNVVEDFLLFASSWW